MDIHEQLLIAVGNGDLTAVKQTLCWGADIHYHNDQALRTANTCQYNDIVLYLLTSPHLHDHANINTLTEPLYLLGDESFDWQFDYLFHACLVGNLELLTRYQRADYCLRNEFFGFDDPEDLWYKIKEGISDGIFIRLLMNAQQDTCIHFLLPYLPDMIWCERHAPGCFDNLLLDYLGMLDISDAQRVMHEHGVFLLEYYGEVLPNTMRGLGCENIGEIDLYW